MLHILHKLLQFSISTSLKYFQILSILSQVTFPNLKSINEEIGEAESSKVKNIYKFNYEFQINKARHNPNNPNLIATRTDDGPVTIFQNGRQYPIALLDGKLEGGFALDWKKCGLASSDFQGNIFIWKNIDQKSQTLKYDCAVEDVKWVTEDIIATVSDDGCLCYWDLRNHSNLPAQQVQTAKQSTQKEVYSVAPNPFQNNIILTGGEDQSVKIWDSRNLQKNLHKFEGHDGGVVSLDWSPINQSIFASGSSDSKVKIWDLMRVGFQIPKDLGGTDELLFTHEGHKGQVNDLSWNPHEMLLGSTEEDNNTLQFYQITNNIHELQYAEDQEYLKMQCFS